MEHATMTKTASSARSQPLRVVRNGRGYFVKRGDEALSGPWRHHDRAEQMLEQIEIEARQRPRNCLRCSTEFMSDGAHHRMCYNCRTQTFYDGSA